MEIREKILRRHWIVSLILAIWLVSCKAGEPSSTGAAPNPEVTFSAVADQTPVADVTQTPFMPPAPSSDEDRAAEVNGLGITMSEYQRELAMAEAAGGTGLATYNSEDSAQAVITELIQQTLLAQAAYQAGFTVDEEMYQDHIAQLGISEQDLQNWIASHGYTNEGFHWALIRSIAAAWMRDQIIAQVLGTAEQVHARQILLYNADEAANVYSQLQAGTEFETLAAQYDPLTLGDLGWFPRGFLTVPELDEAIFSLNPGEYSPVTETPLGFHIVQVIDRDPARALTADAYQKLQHLALESWLDEQWQQSEINIFVP